MFMNTASQTGGRAAYVPHLIWSPQFYTHRSGYRFSLRIDLGCVVHPIVVETWDFRQEICCWTLVYPPPPPSTLLQQLPKCWVVCSPSWGRKRRYFGMAIQFGLYCTIGCPSFFFLSFLSSHRFLLLKWAITAVVICIWDIFLSLSFIACSEILPLQMTIFAVIWSLRERCFAHHSTGFICSLFVAGATSARI